MQKTQKARTTYLSCGKKKQRIISQPIDCGFYKDGRRQLYGLEPSGLEKHLKKIKKEQVILHI
ncbi:Fur-regulated basic protein FbpA [Bacillus cereus]|uniref:Fur-regulated basic protein FbpA n=1 Tax=Bacillus cereus TaxID=1396 RepID=A0A2C1ELX4_BACCE|nr:Fur-regulated basic protein FbpA [Bacillus thuringiensis]PES87703.1 Fur-regulated basic protein FbpA [Bacillus cereus]PFP71481.1 Fur-regulated basic protein FbpA [Bacillus cereus]PGT13441.1 Fur-regulated basic protein FbpA [Bacillus cereus]